MSKQHKRKFIEIEEQETSTITITTEPALKKQKLDDSLPLFRYECANIDDERTILELNNVPSHWDKYIDYDKNTISNFNEEEMQYKKHKFMENKFQIASNTNYNLRFAEIHYLFMDKQNNICVISDFYDKSYADIIRDKFSKSDCIKIEIYDNRSAKCRDTKISYFDVHRSYIVILRVNYLKFKNKYNSSFEEFIISKKIQFYNEISSKMQINSIDKDGFLNLLQQFFVDFVSVPPSTVSTHKSYRNLYHEYWQNNVYPSGYSKFDKVIPAWMVMFELYDKTDEKIEKYYKGIDCVLKRIGDILKIEHFEESISSEIISYLHVLDINIINFKELIEENMTIEMKWSDDDDDDDDIYCRMYGNYTGLYEWRCFQKYGRFCSNPFRFQYLSNQQLDIVKNALIRYKKYSWSYHNKKTWNNQWFDHNFNNWIYDWTYSMQQIFGPNGKKLCLL